MKTKAHHKVFGGELRFIEHKSSATGSDMNVAVFMPPDCRSSMIWLSGLTCTEQNFAQKAGAFRVAAELGMALVCPDTSPRNSHHTGEDEHYSFGRGAGYYVDATEEPWKQNYRMASYVTQDIPRLMESLKLPLEELALCGHSMGGHGALTLGIKNPNLFHSVSALAPLAHPTKSSWGSKAFARFLGDDESAWAAYDTVELLKTQGYDRPLFVSIGGDDEFLEEHIRPEDLKSAAEKAGVPLKLNLHSGYDHSYYFISTFIEEHLRWHEDQRSG